MYIMLGRYASSQDLKEATICVVTTLSGESFHRTTTLKLMKRLCQDFQAEVWLLQFQGSGSGGGVSDRGVVSVVDTIESTWFHCAGTYPLLSRLPFCTISPEPEVIILPNEIILPDTHQENQQIMGELDQHCPVYHTHTPVVNSLSATAFDWFVWLLD